MRQCAQKCRFIHIISKVWCIDVSQKCVRKLAKLLTAPWDFRQPKERWSSENSGITQLCRQECHRSFQIDKALKQFDCYCNHRINIKNFCKQRKDFEKKKRKILKWWINLLHVWKTRWHHWTKHLSITWHKTSLHLAYQILLLRNYCCKKKAPYSRKRFVWVAQGVSLGDFRVASGTAYWRNSFSWDTLSAYWC